MKRIKQDNWKKTWTYFDHLDLLPFSCNFKFPLYQYRIRRCLIHPKRPTLSQILEGGLDNGDFYFSKILQLFLLKEQLEGCFIITALYLNKKSKKKDLVHSKFEGIIFCITFLLKFFQWQRFFQIHRELDNVEYGNH